MEKGNGLKRVFKLRNMVQHYAWGSAEYIPELLGVPNTEHAPFAELWMGSHIKAPSLAVVDDNQTVSLRELIARSPDAVLGKRSVKTFGQELPFLFKALAAASPLSIQAHPTKRQALEGFTAEEMKGVPLHSPRRNYRDTNHKPELLVALTDFRLMQGFKPWAEVKREFERIPCDEPLASALEYAQKQPEDKRLSCFFNRIMTFSAEERERIIPRFTARLEGRPETSYHWAINLQKQYPADIGVFAPLFLHTIELAPGQAVHIPAGVLHSYISGFGLEIMANSDNVLRGGLTPKHIDIPELLKIVVFKPGEPEIILPHKINQYEYTYPIPVKEFKISKIEVRGKTAYEHATGGTAEILLVTDGEIRISGGGGSWELTARRGESFFIPAALPSYDLRGRGICYVAGVNLG
jgi:mannose-6-phosphate isomerase